MVSLNRLVTSKNFFLSKIDSRLLPTTIEEFKYRTNSNDPTLQLLGLDIGKRKSGIAMSDNLREIAMPLKIVSTNLLYPFLKSIHDNLGPLSLVVGLPLTLTGNMGFSSSNIFSVLNGLSDFINSTNTAIWLHDERFTTTCSYSSLHRSQKVDLVDDLCAMKILQEHLDSRNIVAVQNDKTRANSK